MAVGKYDTHVKPKLLLIEAWCRNGLTDLAICKNLDISEESFYKYKREHAEFAESLKNGKEVIDTMVENALLKAALGYGYEETKETADGFERMNKVAHPNTTALIFWLKNRNQQAWRDRQEIDHRLPDGLEVMKDEELHAGIAKTMAAIAALSERIGKTS